MQELNRPNLKMRVHKHIFLKKTQIIATLLELTCFSSKIIKL
jgi:hypothetical protein